MHAVTKIVCILLCYIVKHINCFLDEFYLNIIPVNTSDSLERIKHVPIKYYEFLYDSVPGRKQIGILGDGIRDYFPEAIEVVPSYIVQSKEKKGQTKVLNNFPIIDKNVLYMHTIAALQEQLKAVDSIISIVDTIKQYYKSIEDDKANFESLVSDITNAYNREVDSLLVEQDKLAAIEIELMRKEIAMLDEKAAAEKLLLEESFKNEKEMLKYKEELDIQRMHHQEKMASKLMDDKAQYERELEERKDRLQEDSENEYMSKKILYDKEIEQVRLANDKDKIIAEMSAKAQLERDNEDIVLRKLEMQSKLDTERMTDMIRNISSQITIAIQTFLSQPKQLAIILGILLGIYITYYLAKEIIVSIRKYIQSVLGRPSLVRETSYKLHLLPTFLTLSYWGVYREGKNTGLKAIESSFNNVILNNADKDRVTKLALATRNTKSSGAPFRHLLLHGPPGTGKTLVARRLAACSAMDYAIMSGGDVGPLGEDAINQLHHLFKWAQSSRRGLLIFIDEAEAFLSSRGIDGSGSDASSARNALNALLYQTGTQSSNFMMVLATNRPEDLDTAILDRMDVSLEIGLPDSNERLALVKLYLDEHVTSIVTSSQRSWFSRRFSIDDACVKEEVLKAIASRCSGFSGREISKLMVSVQHALYLTDDGVLTKELLLSTLTHKVYEHEQKNSKYSGKKV